MSAPLLQVNELVVEIPTRRGTLTPVNGVSFSINEGEILGVVGESGAGKSVTGAAIIGLLDKPSHIAGGDVLLQGESLTGLDENAMRQIRGRRIGTVFQDPLTSLNPLLKIGDQLTETAMTHLDVSRTEARSLALQLLNDVGIPAAADRLDAYPHEFSGGMRQRVVIALALIGNPALIIADEPTTALDVSVQAQVLTLLRSLCTSRNTGVMLITHDMGVIAETTDRVAVLYAGRLVEIGPTHDVLSNPAHPYTRGLVAATPGSAIRSTGTDSGATEDVRLNQIPGAMPGLMNVPGGCAFHPRCTEAMPKCEISVPVSAKVGSATTACWIYESSDSGMAND